MKRLTLIIGLIITFALPAVLASTQVTKLYSSEVPIASRSQADWASAVQQAWLRVLIKNSGNVDIGTVPGVADSLQNARSNVLSYGYVSRDIAGVKTQYLRVQFDKSAVENTLQQNNQSVWDGKRPSTLVWIAVQTQQGDSILASGGQDPLTMALTQEANNRGLPIVLPIMDLQDLSAITPDDVMRLDPVTIEKASKRYQTDDVLAGKLYQDLQGKWQGRFMFIVNGQFVDWQSTGKTPEATISVAMNDLTNALASRYAVLEGQGMAAQLTLRIENVNGLNDYADVVKYLRSLAPVSKISINEVDGQTLVLNATVMGGAQALNNALKGSSKLFLVPNATQNITQAQTTVATAPNEQDTNQYYQSDDQQTTQAQNNTLTFSWGHPPAPAATHEEMYIHGNPARLTNRTK